MEIKKLQSLIVSNGLIKNPDVIMQLLQNNYNFNNNDYLVISADGALKNCIKLKVMPDIIIGDMDSIKLSDKKILKEINQKINYIKFPHDKNESDTQLALDYALKNDIKNIILIGALGKRIDHTMANIFNIASEKFKNPDIKIIDENFEISVLRQSGEIKGTKGNIISIFSLTPYTYFINTKGLKYELKEEKLFFSPIRGISNIFEEDKAVINIKEGCLLLIKEIRSLKL
jgi:thiamine pyrophosphokinase